MSAQNDLVKEAMRRIEDKEESMILCHTWKLEHPQRSNSNSLADRERARDLSEPWSVRDILGFEQCVIQPICDRGKLMGITSAHQVQMQ